MHNDVLFDIRLSKLSSKKLAVIPLLIFAGLVLLAMLVPHPKARPPQIIQAAPVLIVEQVEVQPGLPVRIRIPKIGVDAVIDPVGLTPEGDLGIPTGPATTGWYEGGPRPGELGSSVIDGHYGWVNDKPAVFDNLHTLQKGDVLQIEDEKGIITNFIVTGSRLYSQDEDATAVFRTSDDKARLNLITCQGVWNAGQDSYATRLVVFSIQE